MELLKSNNDFYTSVIRALDEIDPNFYDYPGLVICGSHTPDEDDIERKIKRIKQARENGTPYLGICYGNQLAAIEYARHVLKIRDATSEEFGKKGTFVVRKRPELKVGLHDGESYWSNYEVDPNLDWEKPKHFFITPSHPEYQSSIDRPHPLLQEFLSACKKYGEG